MRSTLWIPAVVLALALPLGVPAGAEEPVKVPDTLDVNIQAAAPPLEGLPPDTKSVPGFSHRRHAEEYLKGAEEYSRFPYTDEFTCAACHHTATSPREAGSCLSCKTADRMIAAVGGPKRVKNLFHDTCRSCHKAMEKAGKKTGPTRCKGCHG